MKKIVICFMFIFTVMSLGHTNAQDKPIINIVFNQESFEESGVIEVDFMIEQSSNVYGIQIDFKQNSYFQFAKGLEPYEYDDFTSSEGFTAYKNDFDSNYNNIATLMLISDDTPGLSNVLNTYVARLDLIASQDIGNIETYMTVTDNFEDVTFDLFNMSIKLSDSDGQPIDYIVQYLYKPKAELNPGLDTIIQDENHVDEGIDLINRELIDISLEIISDLDITQPGSYEIKYVIVDNKELKLELYRYVTVLENKDVHLTLNPAITTLMVGEVFQDTGCQANIADELFECEVVYNNIDPTQTGIYMIVYAYEINHQIYRITRYVYYVNTLQNLENDFNVLEDKQ